MLILILYSSRCGAVSHLKTGYSSHPRMIRPSFVAVLLHGFPGLQWSCGPAVCGVCPTVCHRSLTVLNLQICPASYTEWQYAELTTPLGAFGINVRQVAEGALRCFNEHTEAST